MDALSEIANNSNLIERNHLLKPLPLKDVDCLLKTKNTRGGLPCFTSMGDQEILEGELSHLRSHYKNFLKSFSRSQKRDHRRVELKKFHHRIEANSLLQKFSLREISKILLKDPEVSIPHFGAPVGVQCAWYATKVSWDLKVTKFRDPWLIFKGVDYRCRVYWNEQFIGEHEGFFAPFEFSLKNHLVKEENVLLVQVFNDYPTLGYTDPKGNKFPDGDKIYAGTGCGWDDPQMGWHHCPPGMGIYQKVFVEARDSVVIQNCHVRILDLKGNIELWVDVHSEYNETQKIDLSVEIEGENFKLSKKLTRFYPNLNVGRLSNRYKFFITLKNPKIWSHESPWLYAVGVTLLHRNKKCDFKKQYFGVRTFKLEEGGETKGRFYFNQEEIRLRGANTMGYEQQSVMKEDWDQVIEDILLAKVCGMNFIRITQRPVQEEFYYYCDRLGILIQTDFPLFGYIRRPQFIEATRQVQEMARLVRSHPCHALYTYINEPFPLHEEGMKKYGLSDKRYRHLDQSELISFYRSATEALRMEDPDSPIKPVDGDYSPPSPGLPDNHCYTLWYNGHEIEIGSLIENEWIAIKPGWNYACGEFGAEGLDSLEVIKKDYPKEWLPRSQEEKKNWTPSQIILAQSSQFQPYFFEKPDDLEDWIDSTQRHQAFATQLMTEAFRRDSRMVSFAIHLFIDAFPSGWMKSIVDWRRTPKRAFFAYKQALQPILPQIRFRRWSYRSGETTDQALWICNDTHETMKACLYIEWFDASYKVLLKTMISVKINSFSNDSVGMIRWVVPGVSFAQRTSLRLILSDSNGLVLSKNRYQLTVYPQRVNYRLPISMKVYSLNPERFSFLSKFLMIKKKGNTNFILCDSWKVYLKFKTKWHQEVKKGASLILLNIPMGEHKIAGLKVGVEKISMGESLYFLSRCLKDRSTSSILKNDFGYFSSSETGRMTGLCSSLLKCPEMEPILFHRIDDGECLMGAGRIKYGEGEIVASQIAWAHFFENPPMEEWIHSILHSSQESMSFHQENRKE